MKAVAAILLVLGYLAVSHAWTCKEAPVLSGARQIDAGQGKVVASTSSYYAYFLIGSSWHRMGSTRLKHVSVGPAGIWGVDTSYRVYKYVAGKFVRSSGRSLLQVDAGGDGQVVGAYTYAYCLKSNVASHYKGVGSLSWNCLSTRMRYISCGPRYGCWGVYSSYVYFKQTISPTTCGYSSWKYVSGIYAKMIEVATDGSVFALTTSGQVYQRTGISSSSPQGSGWSHVFACLTINHLSYDLGRLWLVSKGGEILKCTH